MREWLVAHRRAHVTTLHKVTALAAAALIGIATITLVRRAYSRGKRSGVLYMCPRSHHSNAPLLLLGPPCRRMPTMFNISPLSQPICTAHRVQMHGAAASADQTQCLKHVHWDDVMKVASFHERFHMCHQRRLPACPVRDPRRRPPRHR